MLRICALEYLLTRNTVSQLAIEGSSETRTCDSGSMAASESPCSSRYAMPVVVLKEEVWASVIGRLLSRTSRPLVESRCEAPTMKVEGMVSFHMIDRSLS